MTKTTNILLCILVFLISSAGYSNTLPAISIAISAYDDGNDSIAFSSFRKMANQGEPIAQIYLAKMYYDGRGVEKSLAKAKYWLGLAGDTGDAMALYYVGMNYLDGVIYNHDFEKGIFWLTKSANLGYEPAIIELGTRVDTTEYNYNSNISFGSSQPAKEVNSITSNQEVYSDRGFVISNVKTKVRHGDTLIVMFDYEIPKRVDIYQAGFGIDLPGCGYNYSWSASDPAQHKGSLSSHEPLELWWTGGKCTLSHITIALFDFNSGMDLYNVSIKVPEFTLSR